MFSSLTERLHLDLSQVDDTLCVLSVSGEWLYAVGDTNAQAPLTHMGKYSAKVAGDTIAARAKGALTKEATATAFSPHSASTTVCVHPTGHLHRSTGGISGANAGSSAQERQEGQRGHHEMARPGTFLHAEGYDEWAQWVVDEESSKLLGAAFVDRDTADLLHASIVAIVGGVDIGRLWHAVPSFPTMSEVYGNLPDVCSLYAAPMVN